MISGHGMALFAASLAMLASSLAHGGEDVGPAGFASPEAVMEAFCVRLGAGDFDGAVDLFAIDAGHEPDFAGIAVSTGGISFNGPIPAPGYTALNRQILRNTALKGIRFFVTALLLKDAFAPVAEMRPLILHFKGPDARGQLEAKLGEFEEALDPARLKSLRPVRLDRIDADDFDAAEFQRHGASPRLQDYGEFLVLYGLDGGNYVGAATMCRFEDGWRLVSPFAMLAMEKLKGAKTMPQEITPEAYEALLAQ